MKKYLLLIDQYLNHTISQKDREVLKLWIEESEEHQHIFKEEVKKWSSTQKDFDIDNNKAYDRFINTINKKK